MKGLPTYPCEDKGVDSYYIMIPTLEGDMKVRFGYHIIKGIKSEFYPCKPDIFAKTYLPE